MHTVKNISIKKFKLSKCNNIEGAICSFDNNHTIAYKDKCFYHKDLKIYICKQCGDEYKLKLKYKNQPTEYNNEKYHSKFESHFAEELDTKLKSGLIKEWKRQVKIEINVKYMNELPILTTEPMQVLKNQGVKCFHITNYFIDFVVTDNNNEVSYIELKGFETYSWQLKFKLLEAILGNKVKLEVIKQKKRRVKCGIMKTQ